MVAQKDIVVIGGPNGAGKTTIARALLPQFPTIREFINADVIAASLPSADDASVAVTAGRLTLERVEKLSARGESFALETTLSGRTLARTLRALQSQGYAIHLVYIWLPTPEMSIRRVADRVSRGGHDIPPDVIRRRHGRGLQNFLQVYQPIANSWRVYDNSGDLPVLVVWHLEDGQETVERPDIWHTLQEEARR